MTEVESVSSSTVKTTTIVFGEDSKPETMIEIVNETIVNESMKQISVNKSFHSIDEILFDNLPVWVGVSIVSFLVYLILTACICFGENYFLLILLTI